MVILVGTAASTDEGLAELEEMPGFQFDEHGVSMVSPITVAAAARAAAGAPVNASERSKLEATLLENASSIACSATGSDCRNASCCSQPGFQCFEKDKWFADCREDCVPGSLDPTDPPGHRTPWSCTPIGQRSPTAPPLAAARDGSMNQFAARTAQLIVKEPGDGGTATSATRNSALRQPQLHQLPRTKANNLGVAMMAAIVAGTLMLLAIQVGLLRQCHDSKQDEMHLPKATQRQRQPPTARRMPSRTSTLTEFDVPPHEIPKRQKDLTGLVLW